MVGQGSPNPNRNTAQSNRTTTHQHQNQAENFLAVDADRNVLDWKCIRLAPTSELTHAQSALNKLSRRGFTSEFPGAADKINPGKARSLPTTAASSPMLLHWVWTNRWRIPLELLTLVPLA